MAQTDPLGIRDTGTTLGPDGLRANEKVTRNYMQFGKLSFISIDSSFYTCFEIRMQKRI